MYPESITFLYQIVDILFTTNPYITIVILLKPIFVYVDILIGAIYYLQQAIFLFVLAIEFDILIE